MTRHRIVSITPALAGQDLGAILADLFSVERLLDSPKRSDHRVVAVTLVSATEQFCRLAVADTLGRGMGTMPDYVEIPLASIGPAARLSREALVSFSYNFQNVRTIEKALADHGIRDVFGGCPGLRDAMAALIAARHDLVHTSIPVRFNMRASYDAVVGLAFGIARHLPELEADMRLAEGDIFHRMRMPGRSREGYEKAEPLCRALALKRPESAQAHARLGLALAGLGRHGEALASCDRAVLLDPGRAAAHLGRALQLAKLGRHGDALAGCSRAAEIDPSLPDARLIGADILAGMGRHAEALAGCDRAVELDGSLPRAHLLRGNILAAMDRPADAIAAYDEAVKLDEYDEAAHVRRADLLAEEGRAGEALSAYDKAIDLDPRYARSHFRKAALLGALGRYVDALCCYSRAIDLDPNHADAQADRGSVLARLGGNGKANGSRNTARLPGSVGG